MSTKIFSSTVTSTAVNHTTIDDLPIHQKPAGLEQSFHPKVSFAGEDVLTASLLTKTNTAFSKSTENDNFLNAMSQLQLEIEKLWQEGVIGQDIKTQLEESSAIILNVKLFLIGFNLSDSWFEKAEEFKETVSTLIENLKNNFQTLPALQHIQFLQNLQGELSTNLEMKETAGYHQSKRDHFRLMI